jgi:hypothetical protein
VLTASTFFCALASETAGLATIPLFFNNDRGAWATNLQAGRGHYGDPLRGRPNECTRNFHEGDPVAFKGAFRGAVTDLSTGADK